MLTSEAVRMELTHGTYNRAQGQGLSATWISYCSVSLDMIWTLIANEATHGVDLEQSIQTSVSPNFESCSDSRSTSKVKSRPSAELVRMSIARCLHGLYSKCSRCVELCRRLRSEAPILSRLARPSRDWRVRCSSITAVPSL